jgi:hypothetical protein
VINSGSISKDEILTRIFIFLHTYNQSNLNYIIMKSKSTLTLISLLLFLTSICAFSQKTDFSGEWKINKEKSLLGDSQLFLSRIKIQLKADSLLTTRVYENMNGEEYPFDENLSFEGKEGKIVIFEMPRKSTVTRSDNNTTILINSATTFNGSNGQEDMIAKETWKVQNEGQVLALEFSNTMSGNETKGTYFYDKVK